MTEPLLSTVDGHPYHVADADAWLRSHNKRHKQRIARQYIRNGGHPDLKPAQLAAIAFPAAYRIAKNG